VSDWQWLERVHARALRELTTVRLAVLVAGVIAAAIVLHGVGTVPLVDVHLAIARDPMAPLHELGRRGYLLHSPGLVLLAYALHATTKLTFAALGLVIAGLGLAWQVWLARRHHGDAGARMLAIAWFAGPLAAVLVTWLGQPDPITVVAAGTLVLARARPLLVLAGFVLGFNHFEAGVPMIASAGLLLVVERRAWLDTVLAGLGLAGGKLALFAWQAAHDQDPISRLAYVRETGWERYVISALGNVPAWLYSTFSVAWPLVAVAFVGAGRGVRRAMLASALLAAITALATLDPTRVFALVSWPLVVFAVTRRADLRAGAWVMLAALVIPRVLVWEGGVIASGFHHLLVDALGR